MISPIFLIDMYKADHRSQYPKLTQLVYANLTARGSRIPQIKAVVFNQLQYFCIEYLDHRFRRDFFNVPKWQIINSYKAIMDHSLGVGSIATEHIAALWDLQYLPIEIKAVPEGSLVPMRVPMLTIRNTHPDFFWLTNMLETMMSCVLWHPITTATIAFEYRKMLDAYAKVTSTNEDFVNWQGHDFSMRGHSSIESAIVSGAAHLLSFFGTDTVPALLHLIDYYGANLNEGIIGGSVRATEHSVMCMGGDDGELETYRRLLTEVYPSGVVSIVSDTWDYWNVLTNILPQLKDVILRREGKLVIRPDSGDPVKIICGDPDAPAGSPALQGTAMLLWKTFGGQQNYKGYWDLSPKIGMIYGDSITLDRADQICHRLRMQGFSSTNIVFGIGSFSYQFQTRDTFGFAVKATYGVIDGKPIEIFKKPKTDDGVKNSARGLLRVNADFTLQQQCTEEEADGGMLELVWRDGQLLRKHTLKEIRERLTRERHKAAA